MEKLRTEMEKEGYFYIKGSPGKVLWETTMLPFYTQHGQMALQSPDIQSPSEHCDENETKVVRGM